MAVSNNDNESKYLSWTISYTVVSPPPLFVRYLVFCVPLCLLVLRVFNSQLVLDSAAPTEGDKAPQKALVQLILHSFGSSMSLKHQHFIHHGIRDTAIVHFITIETIISSPLCINIPLIWNEKSSFYFPFLLRHYKCSALIMRWVSAFQGY